MVKPLIVVGSTGEGPMVKPLIVVGSINLDLVVQADRLPLPGETITGIDFTEFEGGKGANQAFGIARLGFPVILLGHVGTDLHGQHLRSALQSGGVQTEWIEAVPGRSGIALITHGSKGSHMAAREKTALSSSLEPMDKSQ